MKVKGKGRSERQVTGADFVCIHRLERPGRIWDNTREIEKLDVKLTATEKRERERERERDLRER